jgi:hypothetical protein
MGPYLKNVGEAASKKMGEKLFDLFYTRFSTHPEVKTNLDQLRSDPYKDQNQSNAAARLGTLLEARRLSASISGITGERPYRDRSWR